MAGVFGCFKDRNSDSAAMASAPPDVMANQEPAEVQEECSGKKKSKFQTFKKFFARKKRKEPAGADAGLKASQSSDNVSKTSESNTLTRSEKDKGSGSKVSLGNKALSHDSVFVSDSSEAKEALGASQDSIHGKVKSLQLQLKQAIRLGSPPSLMCVKRTEDGGTTSEDDGLPCSPPEYTTLHPHMTQRVSSIGLEGVDSDDEQLSCATPSRAMSPLAVPGDFTKAASPFACLDNSAAKHKLGLRQKACNRRKPASRLDVNTEGDSVMDEFLNASVTEASEEREQPKPEADGLVELKPKVERKEDEEEEGEKEDEEEKEPSQNSRQSLLRFKEEGEEDSEAEQDVSHSLDTSCPPEPSLSDEEVTQRLSSSLDSPRSTPEPRTGPREYLLDPPGIAYGAVENEEEEEEDGAEDDGVQENEEEEEEEESSFLEEVLNSLKTPLSSCALSAETEGVSMETEEEMKEMEEEVMEMEDGQEVKEEEAEMEEPVAPQTAPSGSPLLDRTTEEMASALSCREEMVQTEEEEHFEEEESEEEEDPIVERFLPCGQDEEEEIQPEEENNIIPRKPTDIHSQEEEQEVVTEEGEEPEVDIEEWEKREEEDEVEVKDARTRAEEAAEAVEEESEDAEEMVETLGEVGIAQPWQEADEGVDPVAGEDAGYTTHTSDGEISPELGDQVLAKVQEGQEDAEVAEEEEEDIHHSEQKSEREEEEATNQPDVEETVGAESHSDLKAKDHQTEAEEQATAPVKPPSLSLLESQHETPSQESGTVSPSKTSTVHINLVSPSSEKTFFQQSQGDKANSTESASPAAGAAERHTASAEEEADAVEEVEQEKLSTEKEEEAPPPASAEETVNQSSGISDGDKARFPIVPAWQRSHSATPPSSPPARVSPPASSAVPAPGGEEEEEESTRKDPVEKPEPASSPNVELVLSPGRARNAGSTTVKPQSGASPTPTATKPPTPTSTEESSVVVEGNPDNPFGVRLRKTSALHLFGTEEENTESLLESPVQPTSCKAGPPQPVGVKPSINQSAANKPVLPKKPDVHGDSGVLPKRISDAAARSVSAASDSPSWISVAKQKQKIYKQSSLDDKTVKKEEQERKSSPPMYVSPVASRERINKTAESTSKVSSLEVTKPSASVEREARRAIPPPTPVPPQPSKAHSLPCPAPPKPQAPHATAKPPPQPHLDPKPLQALVPPKSPSCTSPVFLSKPATSSPTSKSPQSTTVTSSSSFSSRPAPEKSGSRAAGVSGQTPSSPRGLPAPALPQDEPPWMALAKKKAKAWSEMPQIVQ